jgi:LAO/AO transport system kinase
MSLSSPLVDRLLQGDIRALSRLITRVEDRRADVLELMERLWSERSRSRIVGVTGPPGAGKSTLVNRAITRWRAAGDRVAVLAVDPSSPFTGGAILGDRIRMQSHASDPGVFIRSLGTRGHHGGLTRTTLEAAVLCAAAGFSRVIVETVGVGQTELEVVGLADLVLVLLVPESGDVVQTLKAGLLEGADVFAVNKADRPGADALVRELRFLGRERAADGEVDVPVFAVSAQTQEGLPELFAELDARMADGRPSSRRRLPPRALTARILAQERAEAAQHHALAALGAGGSHAELGRELDAGRRNPYSVVRALLADGF